MGKILTNMWDLLHKKDRTILDLLYTIFTYISVRGCFETDFYFILGKEFESKKVF